MSNTSFPQIRRATLRERGYHMTEQDQQRNQDAALGKLVRLKQDLAHAKYSAGQVADEMVAIAGHLRINPSIISQGAHPWLNDDALKGIIADIETAEAEVSEAFLAATRLGVAVPPGI